MLDGINNSEQSKRLQNYTPWGGQSGTGISISAQDPEIGKLLAKAKLSTNKESSATVTLGLSPMFLQGYADARARLELPHSSDVHPGDHITQPIKLIGDKADTAKIDNQPKPNFETPRWGKLPNEKLIDPNSDLGKQIASGGNSDYEPVYDVKIQGGFTIVGYRLKADYDNYMKGRDQANIELQ